MGRRRRMRGGAGLAREVYMAARRAVAPPPAAVRCWRAAECRVARGTRAWCAHREHTMADMLGPDVQLRGAAADADRRDPETRHRECARTSQSSRFIHQHGRQAEPGEHCPGAVVCVMIIAWRETTGGTGCRK